MAEFSIFARVTNKIKNMMNPYLGPIRQKRLTNTDFSIISNNCWGGVCYEYFNLKKKSPTVGVYFFADDYIKFVFNLRYYLSKEIEIIDCNQSKYYDELKKRGENNIPIGRIDDIEVVFLHYKDPDVAKDKWERRRKNVNWNNIILKFSYMNGCTDEHVNQFEKIKNVKKFVLVPRKFPEYEDCYVASYSVHNEMITNDTFYFNKDIDIYKLINKKITSYDERDKVCVGEIRDE
ncbi:Exopolysaccharide biosynthesis protein [Coprococcus catus GD/7]|uniref:Exopolysaccharide biosynthesis protein n=1 Tax=Coprococcus catus GD/7 TaxID=717962 RepID=D4J4U2_9FIRM|nr:DUF1919 domain-containing protein [Coprococcus catus]CBK79363.1 Exopolysaccharide biosynthesis protein [Coprococcus catus GD/7]